MNKDRFNYLMNTLPWNLSEEDLAAATKIKKDVMPIMVGYFLSQFKENTNANN